MLLDFGGIHSPECIAIKSDTISTALKPCIGFADTWVSPHCAWRNAKPISCRTSSENSFKRFLESPIHSMRLGLLHGSIILQY